MLAGADLWHFYALRAAARQLVWAGCGAAAVWSNLKLWWTISTSTLCGLLLPVEGGGEGRSWCGLRLGFPLGELGGLNKTVCK